MEALESRFLLTVNLLSEFGGLAARDSTSVPPDTCGAAGTTSYVETINQSLRILNKSSGATIATDTFSDFWFNQGRLRRADAGSGLSDPIVVWDEHVQRFIVGDQDVNFTTHVSTFDIAVSKTSSPGSLTSADWYFLQINTTEAGYDADYPGNFGYNRDAFTFTLNMFPVSGSNYHVQVDTVKISDMINGVATAYRNNFSGFSLRPAVMHDSVAGDPMWFVEEASNTSSIDVVRMTNVLSGSAGFTSTNVPVAPYSSAINPLQPDGTVTGRIDSRIINAAVSNGKLVATHTVSSNGNRDLARWYEFNVSGGTPSLFDQGNVNGSGIAGVYDYVPAIDINASGTIGMTFMRSTTSSGGYMSMYVTGRNAGDPAGTMQTPVLAHAGVTNYHDFAPGQRVGDLSAINVDSDGTFWAANEYANTDIGSNWGTAIAHFAIGGVVPGPVNDNFVSAIPLSGSTVTATGSNVGASKEASEPDHDGIAGGRSVWWTWTAPGTGQAVIDTIGSGFDTVLAIYTGATVAGLTVIAGDDDSGGNATSKVTFNAVAGTTYRIAVDGFGGGTGSITLHVATLATVPNDNFANAIPLSGANPSTVGTNVAATKETGEPNHAGVVGGHSVWWSWTAPATGMMSIDTIGSNFDTVLAVYTGSSVASLTSVVSDDNSGGNHTSKATFNAIAGTMYRIAVDGWGGATGNITLQLLPAPPVNDNFANATLIGGTTATVTGTNVSATLEAGEPDLGDPGTLNPNSPEPADERFEFETIGSGRSVWWAWTAPTTGLFTVDTIGSTFDTLLGVFTGSAVNALTTVVTDNNSGGNSTSRVTFSALAGTTYRIDVDGLGGAFGAITLHLAQNVAPANDNFANATALTGTSMAVTGTNVGATKEAGEPNHAGAAGGHSVWYSWTAPAAGQVTVDTIGSSFDTVLGIYTGSTVAGLTTVASDDDSGGNATSKAFFTATAGTTYRIAVDGWGGSVGNVSLRVVEVVPTQPVNDNFANASVLAGGTTKGTGSNAGGTKESGEPNHAGNAGGHSVWWTWTAPTSGSFTIDTLGSNFDTLLGVYTGSAVGNLTTIASDDDSAGNQLGRLTFNAVGGTTYRLAIDGKNGVTGNVAVNVAPAGLTNDNFANATVLNGSSATSSGTTVGATKETSEPDHAGNSGGHSVWYSWTAPGSGAVTIDTIGSNFDTLLAVYTGSAVGSLATIAGDDDSGGNHTSRLTFNPSAGTTYRIAVDGWAGASGSVVLTLNQAAVPAPANDNFANRIPLSGSSATTTGTNVAATVELGEPVHAGLAGGRSVWFAWTAPANGSFSVDTIGSNFDTLLGIYTGPTVSSLSTIASDDESGGNHASKATFIAVAGTVYNIAVDGRGGATGALTLHVTPAGPVNDAFANGIALSGTSVTATGTNVGATKETGEPNHAGKSGGHSVWWKWTAPGAGPTTIDTIGSNFDTLLGVYTGASVGSLLTKASDDESGGNHTSQATFVAVAGTTYSIAVDGTSGTTGNITLHVRQSAAPVNDNFANAVALTGDTVGKAGTNVGATKESLEPAHAGNAGGHSVWYAWTAPVTGNFRIGTFGSSFDTLLGVYTGSDMGSLTRVASNDNFGGSPCSRVFVSAVAGTTYRIAVDGFVGMTGTLQLNIGRAGPANDAFAAAGVVTVVSGATTTATGSNVGATKEANEPNHAGNAGGHSVWWSWTATTTGLAVIDTIGSNFDTILGVYTGSDVGSLLQIASNDDSGGSSSSRVSFNAVAGTTYRIAVDGWGGVTGNVTLHVAQNAVGGSANDSFAGASLLSGSTATATGTNEGATKEVGEPNHAGTTGGHSVWWRWVAPVSGSVSIDTIGSGFDTVLVVYTGSSVSGLTTIASNDDYGGSVTSRVLFNAVGGATYRIAVDGWGGYVGIIALHLAPAVSSAVSRSTTVASASLPSDSSASTSQRRTSSPYSQSQSAVRQQGFAVLQMVSSQSSAGTATVKKKSGSS